MKSYPKFNNALIEQLEKEVLSLKKQLRIKDLRVYRNIEIVKDLKEKHYRKLFLSGPCMN